MVIDHADKSGVRVAIENGGSFATSGNNPISSRNLSPTSSALFGSSAAPARMPSQAAASGVRGNCPSLRARLIRFGVAFSVLPLLSATGSAA